MSVLCGGCLYDAGVGRGLYASFQYRNERFPRGVLPRESARKVGKREATYSSYVFVFLSARAWQHLLCSGAFHMRLRGCWW